MPPKSSSDWLYGFQTGADWFLACGGSLQQITTNLRNPYAQFPSTVLLIGKNEVQGARRALLQGHSFPKSRAFAQLHADDSMSDNEHPVLVASLDIDQALRMQKPPQERTGGSRQKVMWSSDAPSTFATHSFVETVVGRLLFLFVDVVCVFLDDFSTREEGVQFLRNCANHTYPSRGWCPQIIFVTNKTSLRKNVVDLPTFGSIRRVRLFESERKKSPLHKYLTLTKTILSSIATVRKSRLDSKVLYSAHHLNVFFESALRHVTTCDTSDFSFVLATRQCNRVDNHLSLYLQNFLELCTLKHVKKKACLEYIASALMLDSHPPGMHYFKPAEVFDSLYQAHCHGAFSSRLSERSFPPTARTQLRAAFILVCAGLDEGTLTAVQLHKRNLRGIPINWDTIHSSQLCLYCLFRKPEHSLRCGHSFCDSCACKFGSRRQQMEYSYRISECILCQSRTELTVRLKPPTAGSRLLVLDGGGIRGIFTLHILHALDRYRELPYPIYDEFDLSLGTSTGGLIVLMFLLRRNMDDCIATFRQLAKRVFLPRRSFGNSVFTNIYSFLSSLLTDSLYGAANMEACVKEAFGLGTALFGGVEPDIGISGPKVAVTTMAVSNSRLCILSNYNGTGVRQGYKHHRPFQISDEVLICDAARATSAAPSYFPAKFIRGLGFLQDGGAGKHNNPIDPAEWESKAIWDTIPDLVVSIGTGYARDPDSPRIIPRRLRFCDRFLSRLFQLFNAMLNAQSGWDDHLNRIPQEQRHKYFRINAALDLEPPLDDVSRIPDLEDLATTFVNEYDFTGLTRALFAASFFFVLHRKPVSSSTPIICVGSIRCRSPDTRALIGRILQEYPVASFTTEDGTNLGYISGCGLCATCGHYSKDVNLTVYHLDQTLSIYLRFSRLARYRIGGFPQSMTRCAKLQMLDAGFGRSDHQIADYAGTSNCHCTITRKRKRTTLAKSRASKKRCPTIITRYA